MYFIVTIDTEEDNWSKYSVNENPVSNIEKVISLQKLFDKYQIRPTYLITYPVATNTRSVEILKTIQDAGKCEIGMHCHPWNTPPFDKERIIQKEATMLCNLPEKLVLEKMKILHNTISKNFSAAPTSFRAGRWGFGPAVAKALVQLNFHVDSSVLPYVNWKNSHGPDYSDYSPSIFNFGSEGFVKQRSGPLLEVPATVGFLQKNFSLCQKLTKSLDNSLAKITKTNSILEKLQLLNKVWLSPEKDDPKEIVKLARRMAKSKYQCINLFFHSTSLKAGLSPFVKKFEDEITLMKNIESFLSTAQQESWESVTLTEFSKIAKKNRKENR
ncbi:polysaccharide deacetylase family protein [Desulforhopalus sp. 52FAK]